MKPVINSNKHPFIKWLKSNQNIIFKWLSILLIIIIAIIANVFTWVASTTTSNRLYSCTIVNIFFIGALTLINVIFNC